MPNWLTPISYGEQHSDFVKIRQEGTGRWLLDADVYDAWLNAPQQTLFCSGMPGAGKTILSSLVIDDLETRCRGDSNSVVAYIYLNYKQHHEQKVEDLTASLLKQLGQASSSMPNGIMQLHEQHAKKGTRPRPAQLCNALASVARSFSKVFIVVDALDECQTLNDCRGRLLSTLFNLEAQGKVNLFATSRMIPDITEKFDGSPFLENSRQPRRYLQVPARSYGRVRSSGC